MDKYTELEKQAQKFLDETDTMQFSTVELLTMFYEHQKQLTLNDVVSTCCDKVPSDSYYLGTTCLKCNKPFRQVNN